MRWSGIIADTLTYQHVPLSTNTKTKGPSSLSLLPPSPHPNSPNKSPTVFASTQFSPLSFFVPCPPSFISPHRTPHHYLFFFHPS